MKETRPIVPGRIVRSKAGRDEGRYFIVISLDGDDFAYIADGGLRGMERQKRKRQKHLYATDIVIDDIPFRQQEGQPVENHEIRKWLKAIQEEA